MKNDKKKFVLVEKKFLFKNPFKKMRVLFKYAFKILKVMIKQHKISTFFWIILTISISIFPSLNVLLSKISIDYINMIHIDNSFLKKAIIVLLLISGLNIIYSVINSLINVIYSKIKKDVNFYVQKSLYEKLIILNLEKFEDSEFYKRVSLAQLAIYRSAFDVIMYFFLVVRDILSVLGVIFILGSVHWSLPLALLISTIPGMIAIIIGKTMRRNLNWDNSEVMRKMSYTSSLFFNKSTLKEIKLFRIGKYLVDKWERLYDDYYVKDIKLTIKEEKIKNIGAIILQISNALVAIYLVNKIGNNFITIGSYVSLIAAVTTIQSSLASIWGNLGEIFEINLYNKELMKILDDNNISSVKINNNKVEIVKIESIDMHNVSFKYPGSDNNVISNISLSIKSGEKIAIVGENGAGKSTLINIILGLYKKTSGRILINGIDFNELDIENYNKCISAVLQDFTRYFYSLKDNIAFGKVDCIDDVEILERILQEVGLSNKVKELIMGVDTILSKEYKNGTELSGGQWQKIAIARAMIKDSNFIILDEPTAALDPLSELEIFDLFNKISRDKTTIMISHRLGITRYADRIVVLERGKIVEIGSHDDLIKKNGIYTRMYESQASWYK